MTRYRKLLEMCARPAESPLVGCIFCQVYSAYFEESCKGDSIFVESLLSQSSFGGYVQDFHMCLKMRIGNRFSDG